MGPGGALRVLIAGGGVAGLEALLALRHLAGSRARIELVAPERDFSYRPLAVGEEFGHGRVLRFDLASLVSEQGARFRPDALVGIDPDRGRIRTRAGDEISYDALVISSGARYVEPLPGAITFWGSGDDFLRPALHRLADAGHGRIAFAVPTGTGWPMPAYELALLARLDLASREADVDVAIVTPEAAPLEAFGTRASDLVARLLERRGISILCGRHPAAVAPSGLTLVPSERLAADCVVTLPRPAGRPIEGLPQDQHDFIPIDTHGRVPGLKGVYAAGDATAFPVKQGGIAAQQADAVAESIAAEAGARVEPRPFRPVLRGMLLTGGEPAFLRAAVSGGRGYTSLAATHPLWWPPGKIAGKYLAPHLAALAGVELRPPPPIEGESIVIDSAVGETSRSQKGGTRAAG